MGKKVLILSASPRNNSNSHALAEAFARGELTEERLAGIRQKATEVTAAEEPFFAEAFIRRMDF